MKIYPACECREGADHYYDQCNRRAIVRVRYRVFFGLIPVSRVLCEICSSLYSPERVTVEEIND